MVLRYSFLWPLMLAASMCVGGGRSYGQEAEDLRPSLADEETAPDDLAVEPAPPIETPSPFADEAPAPPKKRVIVDPYAAQPIGNGAIKFFPSLAVETFYSTNAQQTANGRGDGGLRLRPAMRFESDWVRHSWTGSASADIARFASQDDANTLSGNIETAYRLDIRRITRAEFDARYSLSQTASSDSEVPDTAIGARQDQSLAAGASITHNFGPMDGRVRVGLAGQVFDDVALVGGGTEDNSDRNYIEPSIALRGTFTAGAQINPFAELIYNPRFHDGVDRNGLDRDSNGLALTAGVVLERGPIWTGELGITYNARVFNDKALDTNSSVGLNGNLTWRPTELTAILFNASTTLNESASATSSGSTTWTGGLTATHNLRENIDLIGGTSVSFNNSEDASITTTGRIGVDWQINPNLSWTAGYDTTWFSADDSADDWTEHRILTGVVIRP